MKQILATGEAMRIAGVSEPQPQAGEVAIDVAVSGVGLVDLLMRRGSGESFVPGIEIAGTVSRIGPDTDTTLLGQQVFARLPAGGYTEQAIAAADAVVILPEGVNAVDAVATGTNALVAHFAIARAGLAAGERVLLRGASGGIGVMAVQLAAGIGADVVASVRGDHGDRLLELGASAVVDADAAGAEPFDVILDLVAGDAVESFLQRLRPNGRYVMAGVAAGMPPSGFGAALIAGFRRSLSISTFSLDTVSNDMVNRAALDLLAAVAAKQLAPIIAYDLPLADAERAHRILEKGGVFGKIVLRA